MEMLTFKTCIYVMAVFGEKLALLALEVCGMLVLCIDVWLCLVGVVGWMT